MLVVIDCVNKCNTCQENLQLLFTFAATRSPKSIVHSPKLLLTLYP